MLDLKAYLDCINNLKMREKKKIMNWTVQFMEAE